MNGADLSTQYGLLGVVATAAVGILDGLGIDLLAIIQPIGDTLAPIFFPEGL